MFFRTFVLLVGLGPFCCAEAQLVVADEPAAAGFNVDRLQWLDIEIEQAIQESEIPGAVVLIARNGLIAYFKSYGEADIAHRNPMQNDSIFRIASMSKAITSVGVMMLYERGYFRLGDPVANYLPEFASPTVVVEVNDAGDIVKTRPAKGDIRIIDLLTHTSGIAYPFIPSETNRSYVRAGIIDGLTSRAIELEDVVRRIAEQPLLFDPGSDYAYGLSTDVLGRLIEKVSGTKLDAFFRNEIFKPLGMDDTHFYLPKSKEDRLVTLYADPTGAGISQAVGDEGDILLDNPNYPIEGARSYFSGGAGLSSTALDYANFLQMLLRDGELNGQRLLSRKSVELMRTSRVDMDGDGDPDFSLGFKVIDSLGETTELATPGAYSWGGAFNTYFWVDPHEELVVVFMSQVRPVQSTIRDRIGVLIYQALE